MVGSYPVIVRLGDYKTGDLAVYVPVDSIVPLTDPRWSFLSGKDRIKAKKLRGTFSQGILTPAEPDMVEGEDVAERLGIVKYLTIEERNEFGSQAFAGQRKKNVNVCPDYLPRYTDIENLRRHPKIFAPGQIVIATEKIEGECLLGSALISMADGTNKFIRHITEGDIVAGYQNGQFIESKVTNVFKVKKKSNWRKITGRRLNLGRGGNVYSLTCSDEHEVWSESRSSFVKAKELVPGDTIKMMRSAKALSHIQEQVLLGKLLGDASLKLHKGSGIIQWSHTTKDSEYIEWTARALGDVAAPGRTTCISGKGSEMIKTGSISSFWISESFSDMLTENGKIVPSWVAESMTPLAMAFWYMDDGSICHNQGQEDRVTFSTCSFSEEDCSVLQSALLKFGIESKQSVYVGQRYINLNADNSEKLFLMVAPYIPPCMQRKLPQRYRGHSGWLPETSSVYKPAFVTQTIDNIIDINEEHEAYDFETETHNYFAHDILVHNCTAYAYNALTTWQRFKGWLGFEIPDKVLCRSRNQIKTEGKWYDVINKYALDEAFENLEDPEGYSIYGESYGYTKGFTYDNAQHGRFRVFDVYDRVMKRYLDLDDAYHVCQAMGLEMAPILYRGPFDMQLLEQLAEQDSSFGNHLSEGLIVRSETEQNVPHFGRLITKLKSQRYLLRKD